MSEYIGFFAASLTAMAFIPQAIMVLRTRNTAGISLLMYLLFTGGVASWFAYGYMTGALPIMLSNGVTLCMASTILTMKVRAVLKERAYSRAQGATAAMSAPI